MEYRELGDVSRLRNENVKDNNDLSLLYITTTHLLPEKNGIDFDLETSKGKSGKRFYEGDILISNIRPYFKKVWQADSKGITSNDVLIFLAKDGVLQEFLYYVLMQDEFFDYATKTAKGTKMPRGDKKALRKFPVWVPDLNTQKNICRVVRYFNLKIEANNKIIINLEAQAQAIFKSWFIDFEPFQDGEFVESELGLIPEGWEVIELGKLYELKSGYAFKSKDWTLNGRPVIKIKDIQNNSINCVSIDYINNKDLYKTASNFKVNGGELVMALTGATTGKYGVVPENFLGYVNQRVGLFFDSENIGYGYLYGLLTQDNVIRNFIDMAQGSAQANLSPKDVNKFKIVYDKREIRDISEILNIFLKKISLLIHENQTLAQLRDTLLPKLMSGEIDVSNISV